MSLNEEGLHPETVALWRRLKEKHHRAQGRAGRQADHEAWSYENERLKALAMCATGDRERVAAIVAGGMISSATSRGFIAGFKEYNASPTLRNMLNCEAELVG